MNVELDVKELYFVEKTMDNLRDDMIKGIAQHIKLSLQENVPACYKEMIQKRSDEFIKSFDFVNTICAKLEMVRLGK